MTFFDTTASQEPRRRTRRRVRWLGLVSAVVTGLLIMVPLAATQMPAVADEQSDAQEDKKEAEQRQQQLASSLEGVSAELGQAYLDLQSANTQLTSAESALASAEADLAARQREQQAAADRLSTAQSQLDQIDQEATSSQTLSEDTQAAVSSLVVSAYQGDSTIDSWSYVLSSDSVEDLTQRASTMEIVSGVQESVIAAIEADRAQDANRRARQETATERVSTLKDEADQAAGAAQAAATQAQTQRDAVATAQATATAATQKLEEEKQGLEAQQAQAAADAAAAQATLDRLDAENQAAAAAQGQTLPPPGSGTGGSGSSGSGGSGSGSSGSGSGSSGSGSGGSGSSGSGLGGGSIAHPIKGALVVTSKFGMRLHPILGYTRLHDGVDLSAGTGVPQYAAITGKVTTSYDGSCGNAVFINGVVDGNSVILKYCHLSKFSVSNGQQVSQGTQIGLTGSTGGVTGPHVHFSVRINGQFVDPMSLPGF